MKFRILMLMISVTWIGSAMVIAASAAVAEEDEKAKWVWGENDNEKKSTNENRNGRYNVHEYPEDYDNSNYGSPNQFRPQHPGPYGPNSRPIRPGGGSQVLVGPDGPSGIIGRPYRPGSGGGGGGPILPGVNVDQISTGNLPTWIRNDPRYREFDSCKCSRGLNCPGLKFGSCARGKQYCCFNSRKYGNNRPGYNQQFNGNYPNRPYQGAFPFRPFNSVPPEYYGNGDYDGDYYGDYNSGGGYDRPYNNNNNNNRPYYGNGGYDRPYQGPYAPEYQGGGNGFDYNSNQYQNGFNWQNPYNRPGRPNYNYDYYGRSSSSGVDNDKKNLNKGNDNRSGENNLSTGKPNGDNDDGSKN